MHNEPLVMPYTRIVGQEDLKLALEISFVEPRIGGVLIEGERGTAKSTIVRAFSLMMNRKLPVTLPINATEDRVIGGWRLDELLNKGKRVWQEGLLQQADKGFLYVDEVNLLDDHIVNLILDASSTDVLVIQRDGQDETIRVSFSLVGTMNPEEGQLRPQLLDRFGLCVNVETESNEVNRTKILQAVLDFDQSPEDTIAKEKQPLLDTRGRVIVAKHKVENHLVGFSPRMADLCVRISQEFHAEGHRGEHVLALASRALAGLEGKTRTTKRHIGRVARMGLQHRLFGEYERLSWDKGKLKEILNGK